MYLCYTMADDMQDLVPIPHYTGNRNLYEEYGLIGKEVYDKEGNYVGILKSASHSMGVVSKDAIIDFYHPRNKYFFKLKSVPNDKMIQDMAGDLFGGKQQRKTKRRKQNRRTTKGKRRKSV